MSESRIGRLLRAYGVGERMSIRQAAIKTGLSKETIARLMRPLDTGETRRIRRRNLDKLADGLGIRRELLEQAMMADWGYVQSASDTDVAGVLAQITDFTPSDLVTLQMEIARLQQAKLDNQSSP